MKYLILGLLCCNMRIQGEHIFIHDTLVKTDKETTVINLSEKISMHAIDTTYTPQQLIVIRDQAKKIPLTTYMPKNKLRYIKCLLSENNALHIELLITKETLCADMQKLLAKHNTIYSGAKVVRIYHKVQNKEHCYWAPLATLPETYNSDITIAPDGTLHL